MTKNKISIIISKIKTACKKFTAYVLGRDKEIVVPVFKIEPHPHIRLSEIKRHRYYLVDRAQMKAKEATQESEGTYVHSSVGI